MAATENLLPTAKCKTICDIFKIDQLTNAQEKAIGAAVGGKDVFVGTKTGSGKSLTYECFPIIVPNCVVVIIAPLISIMEEQCKRLESLGFRATYIGKDPVNNADLQNGSFSFVFASPEVLVGDTKWRDVLKSPPYQENLKLLVVDEAHTIIQWGEGQAEQGPFRKWFSRVGELRSLCLGVPLVALTATSGPVQRRAIMKKLNFRPNAVVVLDSPDRENIKITVQNIANTSPISDTFKWLIDGLHKEGVTFPRHVIYCPSIADCSKIYQCFAFKFGFNSLWVDMYHSQTYEKVKEKIRNDMGCSEGNIRILICTNAAGMGVNFKDLYNVVHYGLPRELDTFVQQMGRAGRDGKFSHELILFKFHKGHLKLVETELVRLVKENSCRHKQLCDKYLCKNKQIVPFHNCCDVCASQCKCGTENCPQPHPYHHIEPESEDEIEESFVREVSKENKTFLLQKLTSLRYSLESSGTGLFTSELIHGLSDPVIQDICMKASILFNPEDVMTHIACWSYVMAVKIINTINEVFGDRELIEEYSDSDTD